MLLKDLIRDGVQVVSALYPEEEARGMVSAYLKSAIGVERYTHLVHPDFEVNDEDSEIAAEAFSRMASGEPLQYVIGRTEFYGRTYKVNPDVLIPRPETELLCREALIRLDGLSKPRIADLCTGSGCIAWTMALECPGADVVAVDISDGALNTALSQDFKREMDMLGASAPDFVKADVLNTADVLDSGVLKAGMFDVILSNPPYVRESEKSLMRTNVLDHEPHLALFVPDDDALKFYKAVSDLSVRLMSPDGFGIVEINEALGAETADVFRNAGFTDVTLLKDLSDKDRFVFFSRNAGVLHG